MTEGVPMRGQLTSRQKEIYDFLVQKARAGEVTPSIREIGSRFAIASTNGVARHLEALRRKGFITLESGKARTIRVRPLDRLGATPMPAVKTKGRPIPLLGRVAAGTGLLAQENREGEVMVDPQLFGEGEAFALRVTGLSMQDEGIHEGDFVIVRPQRQAVNGELVVALVDEEATVKRFFDRGSHIELMPSNEAYQPIVVQKPAPGFMLLGKIIGLMRRY